MTKSVLELYSVRPVLVAAGLSAFLLSKHSIPTSDIRHPLCHCVSSVHLSGQCVVLSFQRASAITRSCHRFLGVWTIPGQSYVPEIHPNYWVVDGIAATSFRVGSTERSHFRCHFPPDFTGGPNCDGKYLETIPRRTKDSCSGGVQCISIEKSLLLGGNGYDGGGSEGPY
mmetsp:Transcript_36559/g.40824  ORF Transcript_36559/g.40824 Transcript_36559/m.40824 type:complete len:170 (+) Transcript_36559:52-561(+)